jgi:hypothetical protein
MDIDLSCDCPACVGTWAEVGDGFDSWRGDIDSAPFAHEAFWTDRVGDLRTEDTR